MKLGHKASTPPLDERACILWKEGGQHASCGRRGDGAAQGDKEGTSRLPRTGVTTHPLTQIWGMARPLRRGGVALRRLSRERRGGASTGDTGEQIWCAALSPGDGGGWRPFPETDSAPLPRDKGGGRTRCQGRSGDGATSSSGPNIG